MKNKSDINWYDRAVTAERLNMLKTEYEQKVGHEVSGQSLVKAIKEKTGIEIGGNTYNKHERFNNDTNMSIELLVALAKFYEVSYDYILGFSDTRYPEREDITEKYGLTDQALNRLESINHLRKQQERESPDMPTDSDVVNALFESEEFQSLVDLIRTSSTLRTRAASTDYYDSLNIRDKFIASMTKKQEDLAKTGALAIHTATDTRQFIEYKIQQSLLTVVDEILNNL